MKNRFLKSDIFTTAIFKKTIGFMLLSSLGAALADIADALVLGVRLGENGLAAISFVIPIFMLYNVLSFGIGTGGAICYAKLLGAGKAREAVFHFNEMTWVSIGFGIAIAILSAMFMPQIISLLGVQPDAGVVYQMTLQYSRILLLCAPVFFLHSLLLAFVRCDDGTKTAALAFVAGSVIDIILNFVLVFGFNMGVVGAAVATVVGLCTCVVICLTHVFRTHTILNFCRFKFRARNILSSFATGLSTSTQSAWYFVFYIVINNMLMRLGSTSAVAVFGVTLNISFLAMAAFTAAGGTLLPMVATFMGERNIKAIKSTLYLSLGWGMLLGVLGITVLWVFAAPLCQIFGLSAEITNQYGAFAVRCYLAGAVAGGASIIFMDYFQAANREKMAFFVSFMRGFALFLPMAILCARLFGLAGIWFMFPLTEALTLCIALVFFLLWRKHMETLQQTVPTKTWLISATELSCAPVLLEAEEFAEKLGASPKQSMRVVLMIEELCSAILQSDFAPPNCCIQVTLLRMRNRDFELNIRDNALSFNLFAAETHILKKAEDTNEDALKSLPLLLIHKNTKSHFYRRYQGFNTLSLTIGE